MINLATNRFTYSNNLNVQKVVESIEEFGYVVVENVLNSSVVDDLNDQISPFLSLVEPDHENKFMGGRTKRFGRLLHRVPCTRSMIKNHLCIDILDLTLKRFSPTYQVHFTGVMHVMSGEPAQFLHRDITPFKNPAPTVVMATMWAASEFREDNGATILVPKSHLWPEERQPLKEELVVAAMPAGSVLFYAGNLIHGAGKCDSGYRTGVALQYGVSWLRQEENQYIAVPLEVAKTFDTTLQKLMGYDLAARHWGYVDQQHPLNFLNPTLKAIGLDPPGYTFEEQEAIHATSMSSSQNMKRYVPVE